MNQNEENEEMVVLAILPKTEYARWEGDYWRVYINGLDDSVYVSHEKSPEEALKVAIRKITQALYKLENLSKDVTK